ncbi:unnamed protein product [Rhizopus stolonifer]
MFSISSHIELSKKSNSNIFFWMVEQEEKTDPEKAIIWLNGGPGCSSMDGLFLENGPFRVQKNLSLSINEGGWQNYATNIYVDQPVGTGFSFADSDSYMHSLPEAADKFIQFIDKLLDLFPNLRQKSLYLAGESFAGTYIPYFASRMLKVNKEKEQVDYNLKGIAIGNGWISAEHQYNAYYDYSIQQGLVSSDRLDLLTTHFKDCQKDLKEKETSHISSCERVLTDVLDSNIRENKEGKKVCMNVYDTRMKDEPYPECGLSWPYELSDMTKYLRLNEVKKAIHAEKQSLGWKECSSTVSMELNGDQSPPSYYLLPEIIEQIPVLLYNGEYDLVCNSLGIEYLIANMTWAGSKGFKSEKEEWKINDKLAGYYTQDRNLTYVLIKDGSHMVPYDKPIECLDMINRFIEAGDNVVKGRLSQVGEGNKKTSHEESVLEDEEQQQQQQEDGSEHKKLPKYYGWIMGAFALTVLASLLLCCYCCTKSRKISPTAEFGGAPRQEREDTQKPGIISSIKGLFKGKKPQKKKLRLGDQDETNELDELVIENPTLFEAEEDFGENSHLSSHNKQGVSHFTIDDHEDDESDFDDFANWEEASALRSNKKH